MLQLWAAMLLLAAVEIPMLFTSKLWRELAVLVGLWFVATIYASLVAARTAIPSLVHMLTKVLGKLPTI